MQEIDYKAGNVAQAEECLPSKFRSHEFKPNTTKKLKEAS
jgi:hypothetical protein